MIVGKGTFAAIGHRHRGLEPLRQLAELGRGAGHHHTTARPQERPLSRCQEPRSLGYLRRAGLSTRELACGDHPNVGFAAEQVRGDGDHPRAGVARAHVLQCGGDLIGDLLHVVGGHIAAGHGLEHARLGLGLVERSPPPSSPFLLDLGGDLEHGDGRSVGLAHGAHGVGGAGPAAGNHHARRASDACVAVGHEAEGMLVAAADELQPARLHRVPERVEDVEVVDGDDAEDGLDALGDERLNDRLPAGQRSHGAAILNTGTSVVEGNTEGLPQAPLS